jgi:hypothetical protein
VNKADKVETARRVQQILEIRLDGAQRHDVTKFAEEQGWKVCGRQLDRYIRRADALLFREMDKNREQWLARHIAARSTLYARALNSGDHATALRILDSQAKLLGLFPEAARDRDAPLFQLNVNEVIVGPGEKPQPPLLIANGHAKEADAPADHPPPPPAA